MIFPAFMGAFRVRGGVAVQDDARGVLPGGADFFRVEKARIGDKMRDVVIRDAVFKGHGVVNTGI